MYECCLEGNVIGERVRIKRVIVEIETEVIKGLYGYQHALHLCSKIYRGNTYTHC